MGFSPTFVFRYPVLFMSFVIPFLFTRNWVNCKSCLHQIPSMQRLFLAFTCSTIILFAYAQDNALTEKDYQKAESLMGYNTQKYIDRGSINPNWFGEDKFWYRVLTPAGSEYVVVDAAKGTRTVAFDHQKLATVLSTATGRNYTASMLPFQSITYSNDGNAILFRADGKQWKYTLANNFITTDTSQMRNTSGGQGGGRRGGGMEV